jgi:Na+/proline symporter
MNGKKILIELLVYAVSGCAAGVGLIFATCGRTSTAEASIYSLIAGYVTVWLFRGWCPAEKESEREARK